MIKYKVGALLAVMATLVGTTSAEPLPSSLAGSWRIARILPTTNVTCWSTEQAQELVGSTLIYRANNMRWKDGDVQLEGITTRTLSASRFLQENGSGKGASFSQLGIRAAQVLEVDFQHEDMDITGATTEVPGDSVLVTGPNRIVVSACGVFFEATRNASNQRTVASR